MGRHVGGGIFLAVIEGLGLGLQKMMQPSQQQGPISPYSTYKPGSGGAMGRHVGPLDATDDNPANLLETNIAGADNSLSWNTNEDNLEQQFGSFDNESNISFGSGS